MKFHRLLNLKVMMLWEVKHFFAKSYGENFVIKGHKNTVITRKL